MKLKSAIAGILVLQLCGTGPANATVLLDLVDPPAANLQPVTLNFIAGAASTTVSFAGYQVPDALSAIGISLIDTTAGSGNLLGLTWNYTPPNIDIRADQGDDGRGTGTNGLSFFRAAVGLYDVFDQAVTTIAGHNYALSYLFINGTNGSFSSPSGFRVAASDATIGPESAIPEPATMALLGAGMAGLAAIRRRKAG